MKYAILNGNKVYRVQPNSSPNTVACPDNVEVGWLYVNGTFVSPEGTLAFAKREKNAYINNMRSNQLDNNVTYGGYQFRTDPVSVLNLTQVMGLLNSGETLPANFTWRSANNENVPATAAQLIQLNKLIFTHTYTTYKHSWDLKDQVAAATTIAEVEAITW